MYERLKIIAELKTPLIMRGFLTFDALMGALLFEKYEDVDKAHSEIPIKCNDGLFSASAAQLEEFTRGGVSFIAGLRADHDIDADLLLKDKTGTKIHRQMKRTKREAFGNVKNDYITLNSPKVFWEVEGDADRIDDLLRNAMFIGKKRTSGYGEVIKWDFEDTSLDGLLDTNNQPLRPIPVHLYKGDKSLPIIDAAWKPAYWNPENRSACYAPRMLA